MSVFLGQCSYAVPYTLSSHVVRVYSSYWLLGFEFAAFASFSTVATACKHRIVHQIVQVTTCKVMYCYLACEPDS